MVNISQQAELRAMQDTVIGMWTILVGSSTTLTSASEVLDDRGRKFQVEGDVADRPERHPKFRAARLRLISDMQA